LRLYIEKDVCQGHLRCYVLSPQLFDTDEQGHGFVIAPEVPTNLEGLAQRSVRECPEGAIKIELE
jgi:ferredoxin